MNDLLRLHSLIDFFPIPWKEVSSQSKPNQPHMPWCEFFWISVMMEQVVISGVQPMPYFIVT